MEDPPRDRVSLIRAKLQRFSFEVEEQLPFQHKKELIFLIVFVPMELPFEDAEPDDATIDLGESDIDPFFLVFANEFGNVDDLRLSEFLCHISYFKGEEAREMSQLSMPRSVMALTETASVSPFLSRKPVSDARGSLTMTVAGAGEDSGPYVTT